ncbi:MAG: YraN family protein [Pseudomonadota bacterium]
MMTTHAAPDQVLETRKRDCGAMAYFAGCAAEAAVARAYVDRGCDVLESRWRGQSGEIDLIFQDAGELVFVEVKKARSFDAAAERLRPAQARRIHLAALEYLEFAPDGPLSLMRFDLAVCNAAGEVDIREGAFSHF